MAALFVPLSFVARSMRQGAERRNAGGEHRRRKIPRGQAHTSIDTFDDRFPQPQFDDRFPTANESLPQIQRAGRARAAAQRTVRTEPVRVASLTPTLTLPRDRARRTDHAGQHEILGLPLFRQQSALRRAVPQHLQGRPQGPPQLWRPGLLAGRDLQRQPRAGACPRDVRRQEARRDRGVLPRQRRDAGARRPRPATGAAADLGFRRQRRAARAAARGERRRFQRRQVLAAGRLQALHR